MSTATVMLWGTPVAYVSMDAGEQFARFEYDPDFCSKGIELAPLKMPARANHIYQFTDLQPRTFHGLPGLLADSLPDKFGNKLIDVWLAQTGRSPDQFNAVERLCYIGNRGMGALEFKPSDGLQAERDRPLEVEALVSLASMAFASKETLETRFPGEKDDTLLDILAVGTSAGGARAKAVIAFNPKTKQVRSGQLNLPPNFEHWLMKFDGVEFNGDWGVADPKGYGLLEYSYYQVAKHCDINMMECRVFTENNRNHFMTRRFDREPDGTKKFVQTLGALAHFDYWDSGHHSYEQLFMAMKQLRMPTPDLEEQFRRTVFNLVGCNQDDHVKNTSLMMDRAGQWSLSPAYDLCHAKGSGFTRHHQLSINGKTNDFSLADLKHLAEYVGLPRGREKRILEQVLEAFQRWQTLASESGIPERLQVHVLATLKTKW